jgi:hypothetical protein
VIALREVEIKGWHWDSRRLRDSTETGGVKRRALRQVIIRFRVLYRVIRKSVKQFKN